MSSVTRTYSQLLRRKRATPDKRLMLTLDSCQSIENEAVRRLPNNGAC